MSFRSILLVILLSFAAAAGAVTPVWIADPGFVVEPEGLGVLEVETGADLVLTSGDIAGAPVVLGFRAGPQEDPVADFIFWEPIPGGEFRNFGACISSVGDVNGDGHDDLVITAPLNSSASTMAAAFYLYLGGPDMDTVADLSVEIPYDALDMGAKQVVGGGDWNADGYADFMITGDLEVYLYFGGPGLDASPDLVISGPGADDIDRDTVIFADLNGDGASDVVSSRSMGLPVGVWLGGPSADAVRDWTFPRENFVGLGAGDLNGDQYDDLVIVHYQHIDVHYGGETPNAAPDVVLTIDPDLNPVSGFHQERVELIDSDAANPGAEIWVGVGPFHGSVMAYSVQRGSADTPLFGFPPDQTPFPPQFGRWFIGLPDVDGDGADELLVPGSSSAFQLHAYGDLFFDWDGDGVPDNEEAGITLPDCDGNGLADPAEATAWPQLDCNGDLVPDRCQLEQLDCDANGVIDSCEIAEEPTLDCNLDGILDVCQSLSELDDCDGNGIADCHEIHLDPEADCDGSGTLDVCEYDNVYRDCNGNGIKDHCEIASQPQLDCNDDRYIDSCQIHLAGYDCDNNGLLDVCDLPGELATDCNDDGRADTCEIAEVYAADCDGDGWLDACADDPWTQPCRPAPYIGLYFDAELTVTRTLTQLLDPVGTVRVAVRNLPVDLGAAIDRWEVAIDVPAGFALFGGDLPPGSTDYGPGGTDWLVYSGEPLEVDASGDLVLIEMNYVITGELGPDLRFGLSGSAASDIWRSHPILHGESGTLVRLLDARSSWVNPTFADCNFNDIDDHIDIAEGFSEDVNGNLIPDECEQLTASPVPVAVTLAPPAPNPFNPSTSLQFVLPRTGHVRLAVFDFAGRRVRTLLDGMEAAGPHTVTWRGRDDRGALVPSGVYLLRLEADGQVLTRKMALLK